MQIELGRPGGKQQKISKSKKSLLTGYPGYLCTRRVTIFAILTTID